MPEVTSLTQLVNILPNLAFGIICLWYLLKVLKEAADANLRYSQQLDGLIKVYQGLLEKAVAELVKESMQRDKIISLLETQHTDNLEWRKEVLTNVERIAGLIRERTDGFGASTRKSSDRPG